MKTEARSRALGKHKAALVKNILTAIARSNGGRLLAEDIVEEARSPKSPLHRYFQWSDDEAARLYRLSQAQWLIRVVRVNVITEDATLQSVRAFINVRDDDSEFYVPLKVALTSRNYREQMLQDAMDDLRAFKVKYAILSELAEVFSAADRVLKKRKA